MYPDENPLEEAGRLIAEGRAAEAVAAFRSRLDEGRGGLLMRLALARALSASGEQEDALETARETALNYTDLAAAALSLGEVLLQADMLPTAIAEFLRALRIDPDLSEARFFLGCAWLEAGEADRALNAFAELPEDMPGLAGKISQAKAMRALPRCDAGYVRHLFDQFSADYDARMLSQLCYRAPKILRALADMVMPGRENLTVLDLGCGTGLSGAAFKDLARRLTGIDLSPGMIEKARARGIYDDLSVADIETALGNVEEAYDLMLAADTLVYLGDLENVMLGAARALKNGGFFLFTVERKEGDGFELGPKRRWRHSENYLREQVAAAKLEIAGLLACAPRTEKGEEVDGFAVALYKPAGVNT